MWVPAILIAFAILCGAPLCDAPARAAESVPFEQAVKSWKAEDYTPDRLLPYAQGGNPRAQTILGFVHQRGHRGPYDIERAAYWFAKAADQGYAPAQHALAKLYLEQPRLKAGKDAALGLLRKAAEQGFAVAQVDLGLLYDHGRYVDRDRKAAAGWFRRAAEQDFPPGAFLYALSLDQGRGVPVDVNAANALGMRAARRGYAEAQLWVGYRLWKGEGMARDRVTGLSWIIVAARSGHKRARRALGSLGKIASKEMMEAAVRKAEDYKLPPPPKPAF